MTSTHPEHVTIATIGDQPERQALIERLRQAEAENIDLRAKVDTLTEQREEFLLHMGRRAREVAVEHNMCGVARALVEELGGIWPNDTFSFTITTTRTVCATLAAGCTRKPEEVTAGFIVDSLRIDDDLYLDSDWTDVEAYDDVQHQVSGIRLVDAD